MKNNILEKFYEESLKIRLFEEKLLELFSSGKINGTTHTCIGQENNAVGICSALDRNDIILSNHRCHGHFLAHTKNYEGLINEILGNELGVCKGIGGSQHLYFNKVFYSNGILGGNLPMSVGLALGIKLKKEKKIICTFLGDGAFGEGILYECLNIISIYQLPIILVVEDNGIAQTTDTSKTISGKILEKCKSFNIETSELKYPDAYELFNKAKKIIKKVKKNIPQIIIIKSTRLGPHSKGDDTRPINYLKKLIKLDPLAKLEKKILNKKKLNLIKNHSINFINKKFIKCLNSKNYENKESKFSIIKKNKLKKINYLNSFKGKRYGEMINHYLISLAKKEKKILFLGEDIIDPYGGAFKITKNIYKNFPNQIFSTPISEATIVGMTGGLAIEGFKPIVEIMFGDFLSLAFDQILNNLSKFHYMYNRDVNLPLVIRCPMGAGRGYGPTHSQSIEKHFFGIQGLNIFAVNPFFPIDKIYNYAFESEIPSLVIENKLQYNFLLSDLEKNNFFINNFSKKIDEAKFTSMFSLTDFKKDDCTLYCYGGTSEVALKAAHSLFLDQEISVRIIILSKISNLETLNFEELSSENGTIFTLEESDKFFGFGSEVVSLLNEKKYFKNRKFIRIASLKSIIPSSINLEKKIIISEEKIKLQILKEFSA